MAKPLTNRNIAYLRQFVQGGVGEYEVTNGLYHYLQSASDAIGHVIRTASGRNKAVISFSQTDIAYLERLLRSEGINPFDDVDFNRLSRRQAVEHNNNDKRTNRAVHADRIAFKAFRGALRLHDTVIDLPSASANLDDHYPSVLRAIEGHYEAILAVENWEAFTAIDQMPLDLTQLDHRSDRVLVVYRGEKSSYPHEAFCAFVKSAKLAVYTAYDFDPKGLSMALTTPCFYKSLYPSEDRLDKLMATHGLVGRFESHQQQVGAHLERETFGETRAAWDLMKQHGKALSQESMFLLG